MFVCVLSVPTSLDDELGTLVAGEQSHIDGAAPHISTGLVHKCVQLCMAHCGTEPSQYKTSPSVLSWQSGSHVCAFVRQTQAFVHDRCDVFVTAESG